jgi:dipeptidyl aminopeptidase/acylaminoacyl peptidase
MGRPRLISALAVLLALVEGHADEPMIAPGATLMAEGIPPIPASLAESVGRYTNFRRATFTSWHPTRREMMIATRFGDTYQAHRVRFPGAARTQLTFYPDNVLGGVFRPGSGDGFLFERGAGGNEQFQLYFHALQTGDVALLTDGRSRNTGPLWSHQGDRLVYGSTRRTGKDVDLYTVLPPACASTRLLASLEGGGWGPLDWSPDDARILVNEEVSANESYLWDCNATTGAMTLLTPKGGKEKTAYNGGEFSKDNKGVYVLTDLGSDFQRLAYIDFAGGGPRFLTTHIPWDVEIFSQSPDGKRIAFVTNEAGLSVFHLLDPGTGREVPAPKLPAGAVLKGSAAPTSVVARLEWHRNGEDIGLSLDTARSPSDAWSLNVRTGEAERWTYSETGGLMTDTFAEPELVRWKSFDGQEITGYRYSPPRKFTGRRPVIVDIHGGPESQARPGFLGIKNYYLNELGVAILFPNVRGSSGYGKAFQELDNGFLRENAYKDIGALLDWIKTRPDLDAGRVMVTGGSYGGHMTLAVSAYYADRIRCAVDVVGMSNLVTFLENTSGYRRDLRRAEYGDERDPQMRAYLERIAPLNNADRITKPLFVVQGQNDPRVPRSESEQMVRAVRRHGTPVCYLMARDEGHGFSKRHNADFEFYATVMFMREYLLK